MTDLRFLTALPVFNEARHVDAVLTEVRRYSPEILVVDDGSSDGTAAVLARQKDLHVVTHAKNRGYGAALKSAFEFAIRNRYDVLVTIDCDGQHEPQRIPRFIAAAGEGIDIVSGSRYLKRYPNDTRPPEQRRMINVQITAEINERLGLKLTDAFCGFKAYRTSALEKLDIVDEGYAMPLELWVQAAHLGMSIVELPVPLIYLEEERSFGGSLDDGERRLAYYHSVFDRSLETALTRPGRLSAGAECGSPQS